MIFLNGSSCKYDGSILVFVPLAFFGGYFIHIQKFSMVFVFAKVTVSTKLMEWLMARCYYPFALILLYVPHRSDTIVVPGMICIILNFRC